MGNKEVVSYDTPQNKGTHFKHGASMARRNFVKLSVAGAASLMVAAAGGCAPSAQKGGTEASYTAGTYTGLGKGKRGDITVSATFSDKAIESIEVTDSNETKRIAAMAFDRIPKDVMELQSLNVDVTSGATLASMGVIDAIADCVDQAGGNSNALRKGASRPKSEDVVDLECDVAVLGAGAAGMAAAVAAGQSGASTVVFEKSCFFGGNCLVSGGVMEHTRAPENLRAELTDGWKTYFNNRIEDHRKAGTDASLIDEVVKQWDDYYATGSTKVFSSPEFLALDLMMLEGNTYEFQHSYAQDAADCLDWLTDLGMEFKPLDGITGYPYPHFTNVKGGECGYGWFNFYESTMDANDFPITMLLETPAEELIVEGGRVVGVKGTCADGTQYNVKAKKGVLVCTGGYSGNKELLVEHDKLWDWKSLETIPCDNTYGHTGDGIVMAQSVGARFDTLDYNQMVLPTVNARTLIPEDQIWNPALPVLFNSKGQRFVDELQDRFTLTKAIMAQGGEVWSVSDANNCLLDENGISTFSGVDVQNLIDIGAVYKAETLEEIAKWAGFDENEFLTTIDDFNESVKSGADETCGRTAIDDTCYIKTPPFYTFPITWSMHITLDGIAANENGEVLDEQGNPIPGLYAAGEVVCGTRGVGSQGKGLSAVRQMLA